MDANKRCRSFLENSQKRMRKIRTPQIDQNVCNDKLYILKASLPKSKIFMNKSNVNYNTMHPKTLVPKPNINSQASISPRLSLKKRFKNWCFDKFFVESGTSEIINGKIIYSNMDQDGVLGESTFEDEN